VPEVTKVALIGLDTSHTIEFARRTAAPDCPPDQKVEGIKVVGCLRFSTPFQSEEGLDGRQKQLESWGIPVTMDFAEATAGADAIMMTINDPAYHLEYFKKCAELGKPIFIDKPLADSIANGKAIYEIAKAKNLPVTSASSLRFTPALLEACEAAPEPRYVSTYGPLGTAPAGSSIIWYGVHAFEMLERAAGCGAETVTSMTTKAGVVAVIDYVDGRQGVVELCKESYHYGGCVRNKSKAVPYVADTSKIYADQMRILIPFLKGGETPAPMEDALEVMAMLDAAERSFQSGQTEKV